MRRLLIILAVMTGLLAAAAGTAWTMRQPLAQWATLNLLDRQGLGPASLTIDRIGTDGLAAHDVSLRGGAFRLAALAVEFDPMALLRGQIGVVTLDGLKVAVALRDGTVTLGGQGFESSGGGTSNGRVSIDRLRLTNAEFTVKGVGPPDTLRIATAEIGLQATADGALHLTLGDAALSAPGLPWALAGGAGALTWTGDEARFEIDVARLSNTARPAVVQPVSLKAAGRLSGTKLEFTAQAAIGAPKARLGLTLSGRHDLATNAGQTDLVMAPVTFAPEGLQPADFFPIAGKLTLPLGGVVSARGKLAWRGAAITPDLTLNIHQGQLRPPGADVSDIDAAIRIVALAPPATAPGQVVTATVTGGGLPPAPVTLGFRIRGDRLDVERLEARLAGGRITATPFTVAGTGPLAVATTLALDDVDLAEVFKLIDIDGLAGTGKLGGTIPLRWADARLAVSDGHLATAGPGRLSLSRDNLPAALSQAGEEVALALTALADFHYDSLSLALDKSEAGQGRVRLTISGSNPQVMEGQPFIFNINVESDFDRLTELALHSMTATQDLLRRAERSIPR